MNFLSYPPTLKRSVLSLVLFLQWFLVVATLLPLSALAQEAQQATGQAGSRLMSELSMFAVLFLIFYLLVLRPQHTKLKQQNAMLAALKKGDTVVTSAGVWGRVAGVEEDYILLEIANNVRVKIERSHIAKIKESTKKDEESKAA